MAWLPIDFDTPDKYEVVALSSRLKRDTAECFGRVVMVWIWVQKNTPDGVIPNGTLAMVDHAARLDGFGQAMVDVGWCVVGDAQLVFPKWDRYNEQNAKRRMANTERQRKLREESAPATPPPCRANVAHDARQKRDVCSGGGGITSEGGPGETPDPLTARKLELLDEYRIKPPHREAIASNPAIKPSDIRTAWSAIKADPTVRNRVAVLRHRLEQP